MLNFAAAIILLIVLCFLRLPAIELFSTHLLGGNGPDTNLYFWLVNIFPKSMLEYGWFETNSYYPYQNTLAFSDCFLAPSLFYYFLKQLGLSQIESWNILILTAQFLNGFCVWILSRKLSAKPIVAAIFSLIFLSSSYFTEHLGHPQLQFFFFIPLSLTAFIKLLERPGALRSLSFGLLTCISFSTSAYNAISACLVCFLYYLFSLMKEKRIDLYQLKFLLLSAVSGLTLLLPVLLPYLKVKQLFGARGFHEFYNFAFSAGSLLSASPLSLYYSSLSFSHSEAGFFWGIASCFLLCICFIQLYKADKVLCVSLISSLLFSEKLLFSFLGREVRLIFCALFCWFTFFKIFSTNRKIISPASLAGIMFFLIILGPLGYNEISVPAFAPFSIFYYLFPGVDSLRAISRLGSAAILLLLLGNIKYFNKHNLKLLILVPFIFIDSLTSATALAPVTQPPVIFEELLKNYNKDQAVLISPISGNLDKNRNVISWSQVAELNSQYLVDLRNSAPKLLNGYSGQRPKSIYELPKIMARFPDEKSLELLKKYQDLKWIVVLGSKIPNFSAEDFITRTSQLSDKITIASQIDQDFLLELMQTDR